MKLDAAGHEARCQACGSTTCNGDCVDIEIDIVHVRRPNGSCSISLNGQGHLPCTEHLPYEHGE